MGAGIAAITAAAGCRVLMLDMTSEAAEKGAAIVDEQHRNLVETASFDEGLDRLSDFDWIVEAIVENLDIKRQLFEKVEAIRADGSIITSNTSGIPLSDISEGLGDRFAADIAITHLSLIHI